MIPRLWSNSQQRSETSEDRQSTTTQPSLRRILAHSINPCVKYVLPIWFGIWLIITTLVVLIWTFDRHEPLPESFLIVVIIMVSLAFLIFLACKFLLYHRKRNSLRPTPKDEEYHIEPLPERWEPEEHHSVRTVELASNDGLERMETEPPRVQNYLNELNRAGPSNEQNQSAASTNMQNVLQVPDLAYLPPTLSSGRYLEVPLPIASQGKQVANWSEPVFMSGNLMDWWGWYSKHCWRYKHVFSSC